MIPGPDVLERFYPDREVAALMELRAILGREKDPQKQLQKGREALRLMWPEELLYLSKTIFIRTKEPGVIKLLEPNYAQRRFYDSVIVACRKQGLPIRAVILKARQLGFSTFIQAWIFVQCLWHPHHAALTLSYDDPSSRELFRKNKFSKAMHFFPPTEERESKDVIELDNGSAMHVRTSGNLSAGRGDTYHLFHASEIPMWQDAEETLGAALQAIPLKPGTAMFYESTAKGAVGPFYDDWCAAEKGQNDFVPFFAPWFWDPEYSLPFVSDETKGAFLANLNITERRLRDAHNLTPEQLHWRTYKIRNDLQGSEAKFRQEFPSTAKEAFLTTGATVFSADAIETLAMNATRPAWIGDIQLMESA